MTAQRCTRNPTHNHAIGGEHDGSRNGPILSVSVALRPQNGQQSPLSACFAPCREEHSAVLQTVYVAQ
jgi:hypothetical protein